MTPVSVSAACHRLCESDVEAEARRRLTALRAEQLVRELTPDEVQEAVRLMREERFSARPAKKQARKRKATSEESEDA